MASLNINGFNWNTESWNHLLLFTDKSSQGGQFFLEEVKESAYQQGLHVVKFMLNDYSSMSLDEHNFNDFMKSLPKDTLVLIDAISTPTPQAKAWMNSVGQYIIGLSSHVHVVIATNVSDGNSWHLSRMKTYMKHVFMGVFSSDVAEAITRQSGVMAFDLTRSKSDTEIVWYEAGNLKRAVIESGE